MDLSQILSWLVGPGAGVFLSYVLDQWSPWKNWKPSNFLNLDPKASVVTIGSLLLGLGAYTFVTNVAPSTIDQLNPIVQAAFPFLTWLIPQLFHAFVNKRLAPAKGGDPFVKAG